MDKWHGYWYRATPHIFQWLEWSAVQGAIIYVAKMHPSVTMGVLIAVGWAAQMFYFTAFFQKHPPKIPFVRPNLQVHVGELFGLLFGLAITLTTQSAAWAIAQNQLDATKQSAAVSAAPLGSSQGTPASKANVRSTSPDTRATFHRATGQGAPAPRTERPAATGP